MGRQAFKPTRRDCGDEGRALLGGGEGMGWEDM